MKKRPNKLVDKIIVHAIHRARRDIRDWRRALQLAENPERPRRYRLYDIYEEITLDAHLSAQVQKRIHALTGRSFHLTDKDGNVSDHTRLLQRPWFYKLLHLVVETRLYGHSLIQIDEIDTSGEIRNVTLIDRRHVVPEHSLFLIRPIDDKGIDYTDPKYERWLIEIGEKKDLGLYNKAVPHVLYKRFAQAAWSEFTEIFGMPIRIGKTNTKDTESLNRMEQMLVQMGTAAYGVIDKDEEIFFVENNKSDGSIYDGLIKRSNAEISKLINGAVIGEDTPGGSRAKEQVGQKIGNEISLADSRYAQFFINYTLLPKLIRLGYPLQGLEFRFEQEKDTGKLWQIAQGLLPYYDIPKDYIRETFGIPVEPRNGTAQQMRFRLPDGTDFFD